MSCLTDVLWYRLDCERTGDQMSEPSPARASVVVIGGGYGGINVAKSLDEVADVVLVEPKDAFVHNVAARPRTCGSGATGSSRSVITSPAAWPRPAGRTA
jgi:NADPH-dependent 2,4-dienoyl-CoA reductase/sulfur reductase-like enzyme